VFSLEGLDEADLAVGDLDDVVLGNALDERGDPVPPGPEDQGLGAFFAVEGDNPAGGEIRRHHPVGDNAGLVVGDDGQPGEKDDGEQECQAAEHDGFGFVHWG